MMLLANGFSTLWCWNHHRGFTSDSVTRETGQCHLIILTKNTTVAVQILIATSYSLITSFPSLRITGQLPFESIIRSQITPQISNINQLEFSKCFRGGGRGRSANRRCGTATFITCTSSAFAHLTFRVLDIHFRLF